MRTPRSYVMADQRKLFGYSTGMSWIKVSGFAAIAELAAAKAQNEAACVLTAWMKDMKVSREALSRRLGYHEDHLGRRLRGEEWADLRDLAMWTEVTRNVDVLTGGNAGDRIAQQLVAKAVGPPADPRSKP